MTTVVVQIGNTDDKLPQARWAEFQMETARVLAPYGDLHFAGHSHANARWQNACYVLETFADGLLAQIEDSLGFLAARFGQDSIAMTWGPTTFVKPPSP